MRQQPSVTRNSDSQASGNSWLGQMQKNLEKEAVQPKSVDQTLFHQINTIMNGKSKYPSVEAAVEDMKQRSGLTAYLAKVSTSEEELTEGAQTKTASDNNDLAKKHKKPMVIQKCPQVETTFKNYIQDTKGNLPISAIIDKIRTIHGNDISDAKVWDDEDLIRFVSRLNLNEKQNNPSNFQTYQNLGRRDTSVDDIDPSNTDAFHALNPVKF